MTVTEPITTHEWRLVAPWWHWPLRTDASPEPVRHTAPVLQKYDEPDFVDRFLKDPQHRLAFTHDTDEVATVDVSQAVPRRTPSGLRKVFLPSHHRHYLVTCSLHCDTTGFPRVDRDSTCEAGFVVRRQQATVSAADSAASRKAIRTLAAARRKRAPAEAQLAAARNAGPLGLLRATALEGRLRSLDAVVAEAEAALRSWAAEAGVARQLQGWIPRPPTSNSPGNGSWSAVDELPDGCVEATFPLYPLIPATRDVGHDAAGGSIWFGVVPTGSADVDDGGTARFDDTSVYEIRCFVRRHRAVCPRDGGHCTCPTTWSEPTAPYRLASHFDLEGTSNKPVTVQLPSLADLKADTFRLMPGNGGVKFSIPPGSGLGVKANSMTLAPDLGGGQICSFPIPLITIVAKFVFELFLPIVVVVFQLWWMLALRFCIPPDVSIGADASLQADLADLQLPVANIGIGLDIDLGAAALLDQPPLQSKVKHVLDALFGAQRPQGGSPLSDSLTTSNAGLANVAAVLRSVVSPAASVQSPPARPLAAHVTRDQVVTP